MKNIDIRCEELDVFLLRECVRKCRYYIFFLNKIKIVIIFKFGK